VNPADHVAHAGHFEAKKVTKNDKKARLIGHFCVDPAHFRDQKRFFVAALFCIGPYRGVSEEN